MPDLTPLQKRIAALVTAVADAGGVARAATLCEGGHSERTIAAAVLTGRVQRIRRRWIATADADAALVAVARAGVLLTCVTQAKRLALWDPAADTSWHVAAPPHAGRVAVPKGTHVHRAAPVVARPPGDLVDPIENVLARIAECRPHEEALTIWESALNKKLVERRTLARLDLSPRARAVLEVATPWSDSGLETIVVPRLRWLGVRILPQVWIDGHRVDFLIGERLALQIDGGHHVGAQRDEDNRHDAALMLAGYHVIRVGYRQVVDDWPAVQHLIMVAVAEGLHLAPVA
ncbi:endonuclease domain-containing protein [Microbacterium aureliae]